MKKYLSLVVVVLASFALCSPLAAIETETDCARAEKAWLAANADRLPTNFAEIMAIPEHERMFAIHNVSSATRSAIWQGHYSDFVAKNGELNSAQRDIVARASAIATPEFFDLRDTQPGFAEATAPLRALVEESKAYFSNEEIGKLFYQLGGQARTKGPVQGLVYCNCGDGGWECGACRSTLCINWYGCGPSGIDGCWGRCL